MRTAAAWSFPCGGCFLWTGRRVAAPSIRCALLAYRWPRPQQLLAASAAGGARRRCSRLRCCSNPPLRRFTNFQIKQKLQCHYNTGVLGGRGWITQAALLKTAWQAVFARRDVKRRALRVALADFSATPWRGLEKSERCPSLASLFPPQADGLRHPASAAPCLRIAGRGPNNSSLLPPLAALVVVAVGSAAVRIHPCDALQTSR